MPYLENGIRLDIIQNSSNHNSRKTYSGYKESMIKEIAIRDRESKNKYEEFVLNVDRDFVEVENIATECGYSFGEYTLYNPKTSLPYENKINCFMMDYCKNKHIVENSVLIRNEGKVNVNKQPISGKNGNSSKLSQMELQLILSHGAANILREVSRDVDSMDHITYICSKCSMFCTYEKINNIERYYCYTCEKIRGYSEPIGINIPFTSKQFIILAQARGIKFEFTFD
jgi:DNA-directed RNA polymerase beta subunit